VPGPRRRVALIGAPELFFFVTWDVAVSLVLAWVWQISWSQDHEGTKRIAEEKGGAHTTDTGILIAVLASLAAVVAALLRPGSDQDPVAVIAAILSLVTVVLSWALTNTVSPSSTHACPTSRQYWTGLINQYQQNGLAYAQVNPRIAIPASRRFNGHWACHRPPRGWYGARRWS
jgi:hypothetical protein